MRWVLTAVALMACSACKAGDAVEVAVPPPPGHISCREVTLTATPVSVSLAQGDTVRGRVMALPDISACGPVPITTFRWTSSDTRVATVDDQGLITAQNSGTAAIIVSRVEDLSIKVGMSIIVH